MILIHLCLNNATDYLKHHKTFISETISNEQTKAVLSFSRHQLGMHNRKQLHTSKLVGSHPFVDELCFLTLGQNHVK